MKVYVIEKGKYSDRHIVGVTETEEEAKEICKIATDKYDKAFYTEYDTNQFATRRFRYIVQHRIGWDASYDDYGFYEDCDTTKALNDDIYIVYAESPEQAIKIAQDMFAHRLAEKAGVV